MKQSEILGIVEGKYVELKRAKNKIPDSFWETYSAFANTDGGIVIFGVDEKTKQVVGIDQPEKMRDDLFNMVNNPQKVSINLINDNDVKIIDSDNGVQIMMIKISEAPYQSKPVYLKGNPQLAFERLGEGDRRLTPDKYKELVVGSQPETDNELLSNYDLSDLSVDDLEVYRTALYEQTKNERYRSMDFKDLLIEIGAFRKDRQGDGQYHLTVGGLLFFGKYTAITDRFPGFQLDYFEKESSLDVDWKDRISSGDAGYPQLNVYSFYRMVMAKLSTTLKDEFILDEDTKSRLPFRTDLYTAVREALVNSLMHAYYDSNSPIVITAFPDYYEFINPGKMRITEEDFVHGGHSDIRNHTMSNIMRRIGVSEKAGSGGPRIFDVASKYNLKLPEVIREQYKTTLRIWKVDLEKTFEDYTDNQKKLLYFLVENQAISRADANEQLKMDNYTFRTTINELLEKGVIEIMGKGRATKYILKKSSLEQSYSMKRILRIVEDRITKTS
ncbi:MULTISPECIES: RNA-binding domain-containing protein [Nosocomiicoccus]|uniref:RNA-binding domain-containing protein n=2 Tax=Staphylococcaceae TaxID=90964 RepID=UPI000835E5FC|nr:MULTISPECIES: RNA-binding domain-containing protein [Nosocomiicoccus]MDK6863971.1 putative DNA binding domain-containing protein [Nosocomiicoccus ampullae]OFL48718.1 AAA family ATPase [Nosocomiicoccus sp. HMSC067E10]